MENSWHQSFGEAFNGRGEEEKGECKRKILFDDENCS